MDLHIIDARMVWKIEMFGYIVIVFLLRLNAPKVSLEPVYQSPFGLSYILFVAFVACYTVDKIVAFAANIGFSDIFSLGEMTLYAA